MASLARTKLESRNNYIQRKAQFCAAQALALVQRPAQQIGNRNILNRRVRNSSKLKKFSLNLKVSRLGNVRELSGKWSLDEK